MLHPRAYASTCQHLLGAIIDHEPIYSLADRDTGRKDARVLTAKLDAIFGDKGQLGTYQWPDSRMLSKRAHDDITGEMVDSLMGYNDCG